MEKDTDAGFTRLEINNGLDIDICSDIPQIKITQAIY